MPRTQITEGIEIVSPQQTLCHVDSAEYTDAALAWFARTHASDILDALEVQQAEIAMLKLKAEGVTEALKSMTEAWGNTHRYMMQIAGKREE